MKIEHDPLGRQDWWSFNGMRIDEGRMLANDVTFAWEYNPHNVRPWLIYGEFGPLALVWADTVQDALDEAVDNDMLDTYMISEEDMKDPDIAGDAAFLGNASEPFDLTSVGVSEPPVKDFPVRLAVRFAEARAAEEARLDAV